MLCHHCVSTLLLQYATTKIHKKQDGLKLSGSHQLLVYGDNSYYENIYTIIKTQKLCYLLVWRLVQQQMQRKLSKWHGSSTKFRTKSL